MSKLCTLPTTAGDLIETTPDVFSAGSVFDSAQFPPDSERSPEDSSDSVLPADSPEVLAEACHIGDVEGVERPLLLYAL